MMRAPLRLLFAAAAALLLPTGASAQTSAPRPGPIVIDADTANEMDDLFAITQLLIQPGVDVVALNSAHFNNVELFVRPTWHRYRTKGFVPVAASQRENVRLLRALGSRVPALLGAGDIIGYSWGMPPGAPIPDAPAIAGLIARARALPAGQQLTVLVLGPLTNVAAAIARAPDIAPRLRVMALGTRYDLATRVWNKNDFNSRNDINALDFLLDRDDVDLTILPVTVAAAMGFTRDNTLPPLAAIRHPVARLLADRWTFVRAQGEWTMWDLALTMAATNPALATIEERAPPPENTRRSVKVITAIDADAMRTIFWTLLAGLDRPATDRGMP